MRLAAARIPISASFVAFAALAAAQPPPGGGPGGPLPPKQGPPGAGEGERERGPVRRGPRGSPIPDMSPAAPPDMALPMEEPVTGSGNVDLWADRIAARRAAARNDQSATNASAGSPQPSEADDPSR